MGWEMPRVSVCSFVFFSFCYHVFTLHSEEPFLVESKRGTNWDPIGSSRNTLWSVARLRQAALEATPSLTSQVAAQLVSSKVGGIYLPAYGFVWMCFVSLAWWNGDTHWHTTFSAFPLNLEEHQLNHQDVSNGLWAMAALDSDLLDQALSFVNRAKVSWLRLVLFLI